MSVICLASKIFVPLRPCCTSPAQEEDINNHIDILLEANLVKQSHSPYSALWNLLIKRLWKENKTLYQLSQVKLHYRTDAEPSPHIDKYLDKLIQSKIFSKFHIRSGFWNVPIHMNDHDSVSFCTGLVLFQWTSFPLAGTTLPASSNVTFTKFR